MPDLLAPLELDGVVVTADALNTQRESARHIVQDKGGHYLFTVKDNQQGLRKRIEESLSGRTFPSAHRTHEKANGRITSRRIITAPVHAAGIDFPFAAQVFKVRRTRTQKGITSIETVCGITSLSAQEADEHCLLALNRGYWSIENKLHLPRDTTCREDHSRIRKHHGARSLASLKNLAVGLHALGIFDTRTSPCKSIPKMNRKLARYLKSQLIFA